MSSFSLYFAGFSVARPNHVGLITNYWLLYWLIDWLALIDCLMLTVLCPPDPSFDAKTYSDYMNSGEFFCTKSIQLDVSKSSHFLIRQILTDFLNFCTAGKSVPYSISVCIYFCYDFRDHTYLEKFFFEVPRRPRSTTSVNKLPHSRLSVCRRSPWNSSSGAMFDQHVCDCLNIFLWPSCFLFFLSCR